MENGSDKADGNYLAKDAYFERQISGPPARPIEAGLRFKAEAQKPEFL